MHVSLRKIDQFYQSDLGVFVKDSLSAKLKSFLAVNRIEDKNCVCSSASYPYHSLFKDKAERVSLQSYSEQKTWPSDGNGHYILTERHSWPYRAEDVDRVLMIHDLEFAEDPENYLKECWRVLKGEGRLLIVFPNRSGRWARHDNTPFGRGYPYTIAQMHNLLEKNRFSIDRIEQALFFPPYDPKTRIGALYRQLIEAIGGYCLMACGVYIVEASKHIYSPTGGLKETAVEKARTVLFPSKTPAMNKS